MPKTVCLISGGLDSTTLAYFLKKQGHDVHFLSFDYGQRHQKEISFATETADALDSKWHLVNLRNINPLIGSSTLTNDDIRVPEGHYSEENMKITVVPNRNAIMISIAWAVATAEKADFVAAAMHAGDHAIYPDCRPEFASTLTAALRLGNEGFSDVLMMTPFIYSTKAEIVEIGAESGVPFDRTWSCYKGLAEHCGRCATCVERREAFELAHVQDPTKYTDPNFWRKAVEAHAAAQK